MDLKAINPILVALLPVILAPIVAWILGRSGISRKAAAIDYLNKRLDVLERLNKLQTELKGDQIKQFLEIEIEHCRAFLLNPASLLVQGIETAVDAPPSRWARFFLTKPANTIQERVYKGLFYFFFTFAMLSVPMLLLNLLAEFTGPQIDPRSTREAILLLFGAFLYFGLALLFRAGAIWQRRRYLTSDGSTSQA